MRTTCSIFAKRSFQCWFGVLFILALLGPLTAPDSAGAAPTVTATTPAAGATGVPVTAAISATFSDPMEQATITAGSVTLSKPVKIKAIAAGYNYTLALRDNGTVVSWGNNGNGQTNVPTGLSDVTAIAVGGRHSVALKSDGTVVAWGDNIFGQVTVPPGLSGVTAVAAGGGFTLALQTDATIVAWGDNSYGQKTIPGGLAGVTRIAAGNGHALALQADGTVVAWGNNGSGQVTVPLGLSEVIAVAAGLNHSVALKADGTVVAWGANDKGQSSVPTGLSGVIAISAQLNNTLALKNDGTVVAWGDNSYSQTNIPAGLSEITAIAAAYYHSVAMKNDSSVISWGDNSCSQTTLPAGLAGVTSVAAGNSHTVALKSDGTLFSWGDNRAGQAVIPAGLSGVSAVAAGSDHTLSLSSSGVVTAWGRNDSGQTDVPTDLAGVTAVAAGDYHSVAIKNDGTVVAWGLNSHGQTTVPAGLAGVTKIAAGTSHTVALKQDGTVTSWGSNNYNEGSTPAGLSGVIAIAAAGNHSVALKNDGTLSAWGENWQGQSTVPAGLTNVIAIAAGKDNTVALKSDGTVVAWGANYQGQTSVPAGLDRVVGIAAGNNYTVAVRNDGTVVAWGDNLYGQTTVPQDPYRQPIEVSISYSTGSDTATITPAASLPQATTLTATVNSSVRSLEGTHPAADYSWNFTTTDPIPPVTTVSPAGGTFSSPQNVMLTANEPATIYYTTNGAAVTSDSPVYSGPISISTLTALRFFARDAAGNSETPRTVIYNFVADTTPPITSASPVGGTYTSAQSVTLTANEPATIYYTTNGATPSIASPVYSSAITIPATTTLKFFAKDTAGNSEAVKTAVYMLNLDTTPPVTTPSPTGGTYTSVQSVTLSANEAATIYYTLNGTTPTTASPVYSGAIAIPATTTLKFFARDTAGNSEAVKTAIYTLNLDTTPPVTTPSPVGGTYTSAQSVTLTANETAIIYYTLNGTTPTVASPVYSGAIAIPASTTLKFFAKDTAGNNEAVQTVTYTLNIDTTSPVTTASPAGGTYTSAQSVTLTANETATIYYTIDGSTPTIASSVYSGPIPVTFSTPLRFFARDTSGNSEAAKAAFYIINLDTTPPVTTASPPGGGYTSAQSVTLTANETATIYYTINGTTPTVASPVYSGTISIPVNTTLKFFAKDTAGNSEAVRTAVYTIDTAPPVTTASPAGGTYTSAQSVTLIANEPATIYYTTNGSSPTISSPVYSGAIAIPTSSILKYFARDTAGNSESVKAESYTIKLNQTITFGTLPAKTYGDGSFAVSATSSSGLPVSLTSSNSAVAIVSGSTVTIIGAGTATITASQGGDGTYNPATAVAQTLTVAKAVLTVQAADATRAYADVNPAFSTTYSGFINGDTQAVLSGSTNLSTTAIASSPAGSYPINAAAGTLAAANYSFSFVNGTLTVVKAGQTITFGVLPAKTYGDSSFSLDATTTSSLTISYTSSNPAVATVSGSTLTIVGAGAAVITASQEGDNNYHAAVAVAQTLTINKGTAIVTLGSLDTTYDGTPKAATATTVPAGLNVTFTYNGGATAPTNVASYSVVGTVSDPNYQGSASGTLTIAKGNQTITFGVLPVKTYGNAPFTLTATASSGLGVAYTSSNNAVATVSGNTVTIVGAGTAVITATQTGDANYNAATAVAQTLTVNKAVATITFGQLIFTYNNDIPMPVTVTTIPAGLAVTITYDGSPDPPFDVGTYTVVATVVDANYQGTATATEEIARRNQTITFNPLPVKTYGDAAFNLTATASSGLTVTYTSSNTAVATISSSKPYKVTIVGAGTAIITAYQVGNKRWNDAPPVAQTLTVNKAAGTMTLGSLSATYDGSAKAATATTTPVGRIVTFTYNGSATAPTAAGSYSVIGTIDDTNYQGSASGTLVIAKAGQTITFGALSAMSYGTAPFNPNATSTSGLAISYTSSNPAVATTSGTAVTIVGVGTTIITASQVGDGNYNAAIAVPQTLTVGKGTATVTLGTLSAIYDGTPRVATATTAPNGLPVELTYNGSATVPTAAGSYSVAATVNSPNYQGSSTATLTIAKAAQTITFGALPAKTVGNAPFTLSATSTSGLAVSYASSNPAVATISGSTVTIVGAGTTTITASQGGNGNYDAASAVGQTLTVQAAQAGGGKTAVTIGAITSYFDTVTAAFAAVTPGSTATIKLQTLTFAEAVSLNVSGATISFSGGYDSNFISAAGMTTIQGTLTLNAGTLIADKLVIM